MLQAREPSVLNTFLIRFRSPPLFEEIYVFSCNLCFFFCWLWILSASIDLSSNISKLLFRPYEFNSITPSILKSDEISVTFLAILTNSSPWWDEIYKSSPNELSELLPPDINSWPKDSWILISIGLSLGNLASLKDWNEFIPLAISNESALSSPCSFTSLRL